MLACNHAPAVDNSTPALRRILWREYHVYGQTAYRRLASISLLPVLEAILHQFPFRIRGFHSDNGSEFLNRRVAKLLHKAVNCGGQLSHRHIRWLNSKAPQVLSGPAPAH